MALTASKVCRKAGYLNVPKVTFPFGAVASNRRSSGAILPGVVRTDFT